MQLTDPLTQLEDLSNLNKYKKAGQIASNVIDKIVQKIVRGVNIGELCDYGDKKIIKQCNKIYKKITYKGISLPTSIILNNNVGYNSPSIKASKLIKNGDLVKIDLGVHIDGYPAVMAYTVLVTDKKIPKDDKRAKVIHAVTEAARNILDISTTNNTNLDIVKCMIDSAEKYNCNLLSIKTNGRIPGILSYQMSRNIIDGNNEDEDEFPHVVILPKHCDNYEFSMREIELLENEVYGIDVVMSSGTGNIKRTTIEPTIFKRVRNKRVPLRLQSSRKALTKFNKDYFPINLKDKLDIRTKIGLKECVKKGIVDEYVVYNEKNNEYIAQLKFTVIIRNKKGILICGRSMSEELDKIDNN